MKIRTIRLVLPAAALAAFAPFAAAQQGPAQAPKSVRLYVLDCGKITGVGAAAFGFKDGELATTEMTTPCFLIAHPRGTLMWDVGEIPDSAFKADGPPARQGVFTATKPLLPQLAAIGYTPANITYLALSHYHGDHEELTLKRVPSFDFDQAQTARSRAAIEEFVNKNHAQLWIQHDAAARARRKKAPEYYE